MRKFLLFAMIFLSIIGCKREDVSSLNEAGIPNLSLKASFDQQYAKSGLKSMERSFN